MQVLPLSEHTGAEVLGIHLAEPLDAGAKAKLNRAFVDHHVLVVRDQHLDPHQVVTAVELFGHIFPQQNTRFAVEGCPQIHYVSNQDTFPDGRRYIPGDGWHTDHSNAVRPPKATVLHAVSLPEAGGDTQYANTAAAYAALPQPMRERLSSLMGIHVYQSSHSGRKLMHLSSTDHERVPNAVLHPIVRTHPESGEPAIYINPIRVEGILGLDHKEALPLLDELLSHATETRFQYRHRWKPGDFVMWDNRCLLHKANGDYDMKQVRYLYRVMLQGDVPR
jgi:taurine dioxygenase